MDERSTESAKTNHLRTRKRISLYVGPCLRSANASMTNVKSTVENKFKITVDDEI